MGQNLRSYRTIGHTLLHGHLLTAPCSPPKPLGKNGLRREGAVGAPFSDPPRPPFRAQTSGSRKGAGRGSGEGSRGTPTYVPQNDPHGALSLVRYVSWGEGCVRNVRLGCFAARFPSHVQSTHSLYMRPVTFEPLFQTLLRAQPPPPPPAQTCFPLRQPERRHGATSVAEGEGEWERPLTGPL